MNNRKITAEEMLESVGDKLIIFLKDGILNINPFINKLDININDMGQLLRIHFILQSDVIKFIEKLPDRIRNIRTSTQKVNRYLRGKVRGQINWPKTINARCNRNYKNSTTFICQQTNKDFNIKENLVLKKLLNIIHDIVSQDLIGIPEKYTWLSSWLGDEKLAYILDDIYYRNIYLNKIDISNIIISDRMIQDTKKNRNILYQEAAELLEYYKYYIEEDGWKNNEEEIINLLKNTFIKPEENSVLFELYWAIKIIENNSINCKFELLEGKKNLIASWSKDNKKYNFYHDSVGSGKLSWSVGLTEFKDIENEFLKRKIESRKKAREISDIFKSKIDLTYWSGRPDIVIEVINERTKNLTKVIIGEIKYTNIENTAKIGLKELCDYITLMKGNNRAEYLYKFKEEKDPLEIIGLLLVDNIKIEKNKHLKGVKIMNNKSSRWFDNIIFEDELLI